MLSVRQYLKVGMSVGQGVKATLEWVVMVVDWIHVGGALFDDVHCDLYVSEGFQHLKLGAHLFLGPQDRGPLHPVTETYNVIHPYSPQADTGGKPWVWGLQWGPEAGSMVWFGLLGLNSSATARVISRFGLVYWGLTTQQQPGSYQGLVC